MSHSPRQRTQESGELLLQGLSLFGVSGGQSNASQLVETVVYCRNIRGNRKRLGRGKGRSLKSTHLAKSEILIIRIFTLRTLDCRNKKAGNWGKALKKIEQEEIKIIKDGLPTKTGEIEIRYWKLNKLQTSKVCLNGFDTKSP